MSTNFFSFHIFFEGVHEKCPSVYTVGPIFKKNSPSDWKWMTDTTSILLSILEKLHHRMFSKIWKKKIIGGGQARITPPINQKLFFFTLVTRSSQFRTRIYKFLYCSYYRHWDISSLLKGPQNWFFVKKCPCQIATHSQNMPLL